MFHKTSLRLTGLYLGILFLISVCFSITLYQTSVYEIESGLGRQLAVVDQLPAVSEAMVQFKQDYMDARLRDAFESKARIFTRLMLVNIAILLLGGALSYVLARKSLEPIEASHASLERFTADASHELRTPLTAMRTEVEVALMDPSLTVAKSKQLLRSNLEELDKMADLTSNLLRLARLSSQALQLEVLDACSVSSEAIDRVLAYAEQRKIVIIPPKPGRQPLYVKGDQGLLIEALVTILENAIKYSDPGTEVRVSVIKKSTNVGISVKDQGHGIAKGDIPHIFTRFFRSDQSRSKQSSDVGGYGLGLAIAKEIIDLHGGSIQVESTPGKGSAFTVCIGRQLPGSQQLTAITAG